PREGRGVLSPDGKPELSLDDRALHAADAGNDYPFVRRMVPDAGDRLAALSSIDVFYLQLLPGLTKRAASPALAADVPLPAVPHGAGHWADAHEHTRRDGSAVRDQIIVQAHAEVPRAVEGRQGAGTEVPPPSWIGAVAG